MPATRPCAPSGEGAPGPWAGIRAAAALATALGPDGRTVLRRVASAPPLTLRQTGPHTVHLVSTAAGPLGGDRLWLDLDVAPRTTLELASVASTLVLPGTGESELLVTARVGAGARLRFVPEPTVLAAGCAHRLVVRLELEPEASVLWREEIVLGRHGERPGRCRTRFDATLAGRPLLRQELTLGDPGLDASPAVLDGARCLGTTFLTATAKEPLVSGGLAVLPLAASGTVVSALAADAVELRSRLERGERAASGDAEGAAMPGDGERGESGDPERAMSGDGDDTVAGRGRGARPGIP